MDHRTRMAAAKALAYVVEDVGDDFALTALKHSEVAKCPHLQDFKEW